MSTAGVNGSPTADDLLDRWLMIADLGESPTREEFIRGVPDEVRDEFLRRLPDLEAARGALASPPDSEPMEADFMPLGKAGRYVDPEYLDQGGMGVLCKAHDVELGRPVAYKVMKPLAPEDPRGPSARERFLNEAVITAGLRHPGIVPILGLLDDETGQPAYAMELIEGPTLADAIEAYYALDAVGRARQGPRVKLLRHFVATCRIAAYAHDNGVVHGDVKPSNILIDDEFGATWLVDWGLARMVGADEADGPPRDGPADRLATVPFRGPSLQAGSPPTPASDVHALGLTLALILADPPSSATPADSAESLRPASGAPPALWAIALKAMNPEPAGRYPSAGSLADDVESVLDDRPVATHRDPWTTKARRWLGRHPTAATAAVLSALLVALVLIALDMRRDRRRQDALRREAEEYDTLLGSVFYKHKFKHAEVTDVSMLRALLVAVESGSQDPKVLADAAGNIRTMIDAGEKKEREEAEANEADRLALVEILRKGIILRREFVREFPDRPYYRRSLGGHYMLLAAAEAPIKVEIADIQALLSGRGSEGMDGQDRARAEAALAAFDGALENLSPDLEVDRNSRGASQLGRAIMLLKLGRFTEGLLAWNEIIDYEANTIRSQTFTLRSYVLKAAEIEQSHLPWSRPPNVDHAKAIRMAEALAEHEGVSLAAVYNAACAFSLASLDEGAKAAERRRRAERAVAYLRRIAGGGYFKPRAQGILGLLAGKDTMNELLTDKDLDPLRDRPDFRALVDGLPGRTTSPGR